MKQNSKVAQKIAVLALILTPMVTQAETGQRLSSAPEIETKESVVHQTSRSLTIALNEKTVVCSRADYMMPMLKVLIPELAGITLLDHRNRNATAPCMTTGETCQQFATDPDTKPLESIGGQPGNESIVVDVTAKRVSIINHKEKTCEVILVEDIETTFRGKKWVHSREASVGSRVYADCLSLN